MKKIRIMVQWMLVLGWCALLGMAAGDAWAAITPEDSYEAEDLPDPDPTVFTWHSSIASFDNDLLYAGSDGKIYAYDVAGKTSTLVSETSPLGTAFSAVQGFCVSSDDYLYFHDNALTTHIYRLKLTDAWPVAYETLATGITSSIFGFTENPVTGTIWFSSSDFFGSATHNFYLYQVSSDFKSVSLNLSFAQPNVDGGNGPIIFEDETTLLYGEAVFGGDGYFHQINTDTKKMVQANYLTFESGLGDATYGYDERLYVTTGGGKEILEIDGNQQTLIATADDEARGIAFDGTSLLISAMVPFSGSADDGKVSLARLSQTPQADDGGGGGGGCFIHGIGALNQGHRFAYLAICVLLCLGIGIAATLPRR